MAKRKSATALFEVMSKTQMSSAPLRLSHAPVVVHVSHAPPPKVKADPEFHDLSPRAPSPRAPSAHAPSPKASSPAEPEVVIAPVAMAVDHQNRQLWLRMSYRSAVLCAMGIVTVVFGAVVVGRVMKSNSASLMGVNTESLPVATGVLDTHSSAGAVRPDPHDAGATNRNVSSNSNRPAQASTIVDTKRVLELNYVVMQSYADEATANAACKFLTDNGVPCTVEHDLHSCPKNYFIVVGITGFAHISTAEYRDYLARIKHLSDQFAPPIRGQRNYKAFEPWGYKWNKAN